MIPIYSADQIKHIEKITCEENKWTSYDLMEHAAEVFCIWFVEKYPNFSLPIYIFCGNGNNGGDGLAIARLLFEKKFNIQVFSLPISSITSEDNSKNRNRLIESCKLTIQNLNTNDLVLKDIDPNSIIIDAILGTGTNKAIDKKWHKIINDINNSKNYIISIDLPSGMPMDKPLEGECIIADMVFGFEFPKLSYLISENSPWIKNWMIRSISSSKAAIKNTPSVYHYSQKDDFISTLFTRKKFSYKQNFGNLGLVAGNQNMCGAAILAATSALRSGCGLVTIFSDETNKFDLFTQIPEAITYKISDYKTIDLEKFQSLAIGPGMQYSEELEDILIQSFEAKLPLVLDAEAINVLGKNKKLLSKIPPFTILTPHIGELDKLLGLQKINSVARINACIEFALKWKVILILKGAYTVVISSQGICYYNCSGNQGLATAGTGDVLTGIIGSLLAQKYEPLNAARLAVYLHGLAGDLSLNTESYESLIATDIISHLGAAFKALTPSELPQLEKLDSQ